MRLFFIQRENELLRERLAKYDEAQISSNSSVVSNGSNAHQHRESVVGDSDDLESNVSSHSTSSVTAHETTIEQPKYFDRKRRLLAAEQQISPSENETLNTKKNSPHKKTCLDDIVDSLNQKAQAEREEEDEQDEIEVHLIKQEQMDDENENGDEDIPVQTNKDSTSPSTTTTTTPIPSKEREDNDDDEDVDIDDTRLTVVADDDDDVDDDDDH